MSSVENAEKVGISVSCTKDTISLGMKIVGAAVPSVSPSPMLTNILLKPEQSSLVFSATDLELWVTYQTSIVGCTGSGAAVPASKFSEVLASLPDSSDVAISSRADGKVSIKCGKSRFVISGTAASEYPVFPVLDESSSFRVDTAALISSINSTLFSICNDRARRILGGVCWSGSSGRLEMASSDSCRMSVATKNGPAGTADFRVIVPEKVLSELVRVVGLLGYDGDILCFVSENSVAFRFGGVTMLSRTVAGNFPKYDHMMNRGGKSLVADTAKLAALSKRAMVCTVSGFGSVKYSISKGLIRASSCSQTVEFDDEIPVEYSGPDTVIGFNPRFLLEALQHVGSANTVLSFSSEMAPVILEPKEPSGARFLVMPMMVTKEEKSGN